MGVRGLTISAEYYDQILKEKTIGEQIFVESLSDLEEEIPAAVEMGKDGGW